MRAVCFEGMPDSAGRGSSEGLFFICGLSLPKSLPFSRKPPPGALAFPGPVEDIATGTYVFVSLGFLVWGTVFQPRDLQKGMSPSHTPTK